MCNLMQGVKRTHPGLYARCDKKRKEKKQKPFKVDSDWEENIQEAQSSTNSIDL